MKTNPTQNSKFRIPGSYDRKRHLFTSDCGHDSV